MRNENWRNHPERNPDIMIEKDNPKKEEPPNIPWWFWMLLGLGFMMRG